MPNQVGTSKIIRFATFEVDLQAQELRKGGLRLKLSGQPFEVLAILLERPGTVVTREGLQKQLWPDTFVDADHNLNTAINKIREALGDSSENPRFVETLPRRGYRFIGQISLDPDSVRGTSKAAKGRHRGLRIATWCLVGTACSIAVLVAYWRSAPKPESVFLKPRPFTTLPGVEMNPEFSPDGSRIAFAWNGDADVGRRGYDLYVKAIGSETMLRLTHHPSESIDPAWSPDGTQIAFHRLSGADTGLYVVPALGGVEKKLRSTRVNKTVDIRISWSSDGKWIAFTDYLPETTEPRVFLLSVESLESRQVAHAPRCMFDGLPAFSRSSKQLAYECAQTGIEKFGIYSVRLPDGAPKLIATHEGFPMGMAWSADDRRLFFSEMSDANAGHINELSLSDSSIRQLMLGQSASVPTISPHGDKLAYSATSDNINIWRKDLLHPEIPAQRLMSSTRDQGQAQYSPDGKHIAFVSNRSGYWEVWLSDADGGNLVQVSKQGGGGPRWSYDGKKIAFDTGSEIYIADISELVPRKLMTSVPLVFSPSWSHDGRWIYFTSHESARQRTYRCPSAGGDAEPVSAQTAYSPLESDDGSKVYFATLPSKPILKAVSLDRLGAEFPVEGLPPLLSAGNWTIVPGGIYFVSAEAPRLLQYFDVKTRKTHRVFELEKEFDWGLSASADGRWIIYSQLDEENWDIMLVDHFR